MTEPLSDESIVFLHEDLHVSRDCFDQNDVLFDEVTPAWRDFCRDALEFRVPDWEEESRRVRETLARLEDGPDAR